jgi:hypothetical protein
MALPDLKGRPSPSLRDLRAYSSPNVFDGRRPIPEEIREETRAIARQAYIRTFGEPASRPEDTATTKAPKTYPLD